jgi:hypothetical protein
LETTPLAQVILGVSTSALGILYAVDIACWLAECECGRHGAVLGTALCCSGTVPAPGVVLLRCSAAGCTAPVRAACCLTEVPQHHAVLQWCVGGLRHSMT